MRLAVTPLEDRNGPVMLSFDYRFWPEIEATPFAWAIEDTATEMASRMVRLAGAYRAEPIGYLASTPWGRVQAQKPIADMLVVYVGPSPPGTLGIGGPVSFSASGPGVTPQYRMPGMVLGLNPDPVTWQEFDLGTVVRHELGHGISFVSHIPDDRALMAPYLPPGVVRTPTPLDILAARQQGWDIRSLPSDAVVKAMGGIWGEGGFAILTAHTAATWLAEGRFTEWEMLPAGTPTLR